MDRDVEISLPAIGGSFSSTTAPRGSPGRAGWD